MKIKYVTNKGIIIEYEGSSKDFVKIISIISELKVTSSIETINGDEDE